MHDRKSKPRRAEEPRDPDPSDARQTRAPAPLTDRVPVDALQEMQDRFAALGGTSLCICTVDGAPITTPSWGSRFSALIATSPKGKNAFHQSLKTFARDIAADVASVCHPGTTLYAAPIVHNQHRLAIMVVGTRPTGPPTADGVRDIAQRFDLSAHDLIDAARRVEPWTGDVQRATYAFAESLARTIATLYAQADEIRRQLGDLQTVHELTQALSGTGDVQDGLNLTTRRVVEVMAVKACGIRLLDEETGELVITAVENLSDAYLNKGPVMLGDNEIDRRAFDGETVYIDDTRTDPRIRYPADARREGLVSGLCVPMTHRGQTVGVLRVYTDHHYRFTPDETALLRSLASQAASAIINARLRDKQRADERFKAQVRYAGEIQRRMLPASPPDHPALAFGCAYAPTRLVGGDGYDFIELPDGRVGMCIVDVVGKGLPAALMLASVRSALRAEANCGHDTAGVMARVNRHMCRDTLIGEFATLVYGVFSRDGRRFTYCNAGHDPPLLVRDRAITPHTTGGPVPDGAADITACTAGGMVIGIDPDTPYNEHTVDLARGDCLVLTTDGVTEALNFQDEAYGAARLRDSIHRHRNLDADHFAAQLLWDVRRFAGLAEQSDDITIVVVRCL